MFLFYMGLVVCDLFLSITLFQLAGIKTTCFGSNVSTVISTTVTYSHHLVLPCNTPLEHLHSSCLWSPSKRRDAQMRLSH
ncbi:hypothetical protein L208DRAFT_657385 [Tricholoma matsutake]|nr:hypothetical protein L208DRAFT_657385 [Tricholoma matsutake 945]